MIKTISVRTSEPTDKEFRIENDTKKETIAIWHNGEYVCTIDWIEFLTLINAIKEDWE